MIDIHTHLLPGVDDGSPSIAVSLPVLEEFGEGGVTVVVCTPHLDASAVASAPYAPYREILEELRIEAPPVPQLFLGWEIMLDVPGADLTDHRLSLGHSNAVLVEFARMAVPVSAGDELFRIRQSGVVPVIAHPERYWNCTPSLVAQWRNVGAVIQMDVSALVGSRRLSALAEAMLARGLVDIVASDTHGDRRSLVAGRRWLEEVTTLETAELLTMENARRLLANEELVPVEPIELRHGMLHRLRDLLLPRA